jgi:hypothetical protein
MTAARIHTEDTVGISSSGTLNLRSGEASRRKPASALSFCRSCSSSERQYSEARPSRSVVAWAPSWSCPTDSLLSHLIHQSAGHPLSQNHCTIVHGGMVGVLLCAAGSREGTTVAPPSFRTRLTCSRCWPTNTASSRTLVTYPRNQGYPALWA